MIWTLLRDRDPNRIAAYFDPGHAAVEGGNGGWRQSLELLAPHIRLVADQGLRLEVRARQAQGRLARRSRSRCATGIVPWPEFFDGSRSAQFDGPISLHSEYQGHA